VQTATARPAQRLRSVGKCPAWVRSEIIFDFAQERLRKILQLLLAHAGNSPKLGRGRWIISRHFTERDIGEDDVSRHIAFVGELTAKASQTPEQRFVAFDRARTRLLIPCDNFNLLRECDWG